MKKTNKINAAEKELLQQLNQPGHKAERKAFHAARRGERIPSSRVAIDKKQKSRSRTALKKKMRDEFF